VREDYPSASVSSFSGPPIPAGSGRSHADIHPHNAAKDFLIIESSNLAELR
jgi:hypothetical protein